MLVVSYKTKGKATKEAIKACDDGAKAMRNLVLICAEATGANRIQRAIMWFIFRLYKRVITEEEVRYEFYLVPNMPNGGNKV